jgi:hypothetical protein
MKVLRANMFRNSVVALDENGEEVEMTLDEWRAKDPKRPDGVAAHSGHAGHQDHPVRVPGGQAPRPQRDALVLVTADPESPNGMDGIDEMDGPDLPDLMDGPDFAAEEPVAPAEPAENGEPEHAPEHVADAPFRNSRKRRRRP